MTVNEIKALDYPYSSHSFNPLVIACYNNLFKNSTVLTSDMFVVKQQRKTSVFLLGSTIPAEAKSFNKPVFISESIVSKNEDLETVYVIDDVLNTDDATVRRGLKFNDRPQINIIETENSKKHLLDKMKIFNLWVDYKNNDPKVYKMTFNPNRYKRAIGLRNYDFNIVEYICYANGEPFGFITCAVNKETVYVIAACTRFFDKRLRVVADMSEYFLIYSMFLMKQKGIKNVNYGPAGGITGLKTYKNQFPHSYTSVYRLTI